ncbi:MAG: glycosyltransferase family 4 protein [Bacteroidota bacterium]
MIALFNSNLAWGGGEWWHFQFASWLNRQGKPVVVFCDPQGKLYEKCQRESLQTQPVKIGNLSYLHLQKRNQLKKQFERFKVKHLIINGSADLKLAGPVAKKANVARITYRRGLDKPVKQNRHNRWLLNQVVTDILSNTEATKRALLGAPPITDPSNIQVIYNPIDTERFRPSNSKKVSSSLILGAAGRLVEQKGFELLLGAMVQIEKQYPDVELHIAGTGPIEQDLQRQVVALGLQSVKFLGFVSDMPSFFQKLDVFVFPSRFEGFGFALAEAMATGVPVVSFNVSSNPELIDDQQTGFLVQAYDIEQFARRVIDLLSDADRRKQMGQFARQVVVDRFSQPVVERAWQAFLYNEE